MPESNTNGRFTREMSKKEYISRSKVSSKNLDISKSSNSLNNLNMLKNQGESDPTQTYERYTTGYGDSIQPKNKIQYNASRYTEENARESGSRVKL